MVPEDHQLKVCEIAHSCPVSSKRVFHILTEELGMEKLSARWMPRPFLILDQKRMRMDILEQCLACFRKNKEDILHQFVTTNENWVHYYSVLHAWRKLIFKMESR